MNLALLQRLLAPILLTAGLLYSPLGALAQEAEFATDDEAVQQSEAAQQSEDDAEAEAMAESFRQLQRQMLRATAATLEDRLTQLSEQNGLYDLSLVEVQTDLGRIYRDLGDYDKAVDVLTQALHLVRLNSGLYDPQQIRILEELVEALFRQSDWDKVDDYQHLVFSLQKRSYAPDSPEFADAVLAMGRWQLASDRLGRTHGFQVIDQINEMKDLFNAQLEYARAREDVERQWSLVYASAMADLALARQYLRPDVNDMMITAQRYVTRTVCRNVSDGAGGISRVCWQESVPNPDYYYQVNNERRNRMDRARVSLTSARRQLEEILENNPEFASVHEEDTRIGLENLSRELRDLQRDSRMRMLGVW
ncbi:MAG TPA: tetratricopeptide repeat protein [Pseudohongiella sp.]|nr:tetratricopeptide repeat protein [Pseudohongiella sp.]